MTEKVVRVRGYNLKTFREYYFSQRLTDRSEGSSCQRDTTETEKIFELIRHGNAQVIIVGDLDDICKSDCQSQNGCPFPLRGEQDKHHLKKYGFEVGQTYDSYEVMRRLGIDQDF